MELEKLVNLYNTKNEIIIKRKKVKLDFTITVGLLFRHDLRILVDDENLCIGKNKIKIKDLKKIYIYKECYKAQKSLPSCTSIYVHWLKFEGKNMMTKSINLEDLSENDIDKIDKLFKHFIFSNETEYNRLNSNDYEFLITDNSTISTYKLNEYTDKQKQDQIIKMNSKEYCFIKVLPKKYYKKYLKKDYILFETKYQNLNYMDVWQDKNKKTVETEDVLSPTIITIVSMSLILFVICIISFWCYLFL